MAMLTDLSRLIAEGEGGHGFTRPLPMEPWVYGAIAVAVVVLALVFTWVFRHTAQAMIEGDARAHARGAHATPPGGGH